MNVALTKLIPASALALSLVVFTSCKIEDLAPDLEPYFKEITGSDTTTFMSALTSATSQTGGTQDFQEGFKAGYAAGYTEAAKTTIVQAPKVSAPAPPAAPEPTSSPYVAASTTVASSSSIPSWGYTSEVMATTPDYVAKPNPTKSSSSSSSSSNYNRYSRSSRSSRGCAGGS